MINEAAGVAAPASLLRRGPQVFIVMDRPAHIVAIAIVMQSAHARQPNRHAIAVRERYGVNDRRRTRIRRARLRAVVLL
ncbi:hypothetical protein [Burkholderia sp. BCC0322]|uniref:hypothetical protein n=1 Tax=unclassified Burkholderia TaxID=2613784 RepID=UPI001588946B|nr:hypothetical protein [Burkholderia sp. BCC0322]